MTADPFFENFSFVFAGQRILVRFEFALFLSTMQQGSSYNIRTKICSLFTLTPNSAGGHARRGRPTDQAGCHLV